jgi:trigger factor
LYSQEEDELMSAVIEKTENNVATLTIEVSPEDFNKAIQKSYNKNKKYYNVPGFRKGKAPRKIIEQHYGENAFVEDAIDFAFPDAYEAAIKEHDLQPVARPELTEIKTASATEGLVFTILVPLLPEVTLGEYKGATIQTLNVRITKKEIEEELERMQNQNARIVSKDEGPIEDTQIAIIDFEGFSNDEPFEGGKGDDYELVLGSNTFIPGFEDQVVGMNIDEEKDINVTFPEDYHQAELAGQPVVFKVKLKEIKVKELPELDDEFAKDVSEFDTLEELSEDIKQKAKTNKEADRKKKADEAVINKAIETSDITLPDAMVQEEVEKTMQDFEQQLAQQGLNIESYYQYLNIDKDTFEGNLREDAIKKIKGTLALEKIAEVEAIEVSEEDFEAELGKYAEQFGQEISEFKENMNDSLKEYITKPMITRKTIDFLVENAVVK